MKQGAQQVKIAFPMQFQRHVSPRVAGETAKMLEASGVIDELMIFDALVSFNPRALWTPDNTPLANTYENDDSFHDAFILAAIVAASSNLGICIQTDSMRRGPWISQTMFSLADTTSGQITLALGAGESRHGKPFGYDRKEGLGRLKDLMQIWNRMLDCDGPFDFGGRYWKLEHAYLGTQRPARRPKLWALGGGPKLIEAAARDADGVMVFVPGVWASPAQCAEAVAGIKEAVARNGRNPDAFTIAMQVGIVLHEDPEEIERTLRHPQVKFISALFGRMSMVDWVKEGHVPPFPEGWSFANDLFPVTITRAECEAALNRMTPEMMRKSNIVGTPAAVAAQLQKYVDAGVSWIALSDLGGYCSMDPMGPVGRMIDVAKILKGK